MSTSKESGGEKCGSCAKGRGAKKTVPVPYATVSTLHVIFIEKLEIDFFFVKFIRTYFGKKISIYFIKLKFLFFDFFSPFYYGLSFVNKYFIYI